MYFFSFFCITLYYSMPFQYKCAIFLILDPKRMGEDNPLIAEFEVQKHLNFPLGFHGFWATDT